jgi:hypothetical protein
MSACLSPLIPTIRYNYPLQGSKPPYTLPDEMPKHNAIVFGRPESITVNNNFIAWRHLSRKLYYYLTRVAAIALLYRAVPVCTHNDNYNIP